MDKLKKNLLYRKAEVTWGQRAQVIVALEELAELQSALVATLLNSGTKTEDISPNGMDIGDFLLEVENMALTVKRRCKVFRALKYDETNRLLPNIDLGGELTDSKIMIEQMAHMFNLEESMELTEEKKLDRLDHRLKDVVTITSTY